MAKSHTTTRAHSSEYFGKERDFWWNSDFLDLLAHRLDLKTIRRAADIGCGVGHWSGLLYPRLAPGAEMVGVDREQTYLTQYLSRLRTVAPETARLEALQGDALNLPLADGSLDMTTCQTLLLHLDRPEAALREMIRVTRPGGLVLCVEPNNLISRLPFSGLMAEQDIERLITASEMAWRYVLGRARLGKGAEYMGELLPGLFAKLGLQNVQVWLSDKASPIVPPYAGEEESAVQDTWEKWMAEGIGPFDRAEARANILAGGGSEEAFDSAWQAGMEDCRDTMKARREGRWHCAGGGLFYIVAGHTPG
jgi:SAM-dependent methyltransferase